MTVLRRLLATALVLVLPACGSLGPYPQVGQKLDVNIRIVGAETWMAAGTGAEGPQIRILVLGKDADGIPTFSHDRLDVPVGSGVSAAMMQGFWAESGGVLTLTEQTSYLMANERSKSLSAREGATRTDGLNVPHRLTVTRTADRLVLGGDATLDGTYIPVASALGNLAAALAQAPACAFHVANLAVMTTQVRIIGFGSAAMLQYRSPESFQGTLSGRVDIAMSGALLAPDVDIAYTDQSDFGGVLLGGGLHTHSDQSGNGQTTSTVRFTFQADATAQPITGSVDYALVITRGYATDGQYTITVDGGGTGTATPQDPPSPPPATCLGLP